MVQLSALLTGLLTAAATVSACPSKDTEKACGEIAAEVPDRVSTRFEIPYTSEVLSYWSHVPRDHKPACLVLPQSAQEVAAVVKVLNKYPDVRFAVKSGGHDPNLGHASVQDGVLISTKDLAGVTYDAEKQLAYVKPGGEWNDVIGVLDAEGVAIVGGRLGLVGVGGYLLQGGISFLSSQYGLAADSIVGWEIVTADGSIINVDAKEDPELAVALRGSGSQFGIVTQFTVQTHPMPSEVWGGMRIYGGDKAEEIFSALHEFTPNNADDEKAAIILTDNVTVGGLRLFIIFYYYEGPEPPTEGAFADFLKIQSATDATKKRSYADLLKTNGEGAALLQARISFRTYTIPYLPDVPEMYEEISAKFQSLVKDYLTILRPTSQCSVDFQPFPAVIGQHSQERGGNALGIAGSDPDRLLLEIQCSWTLQSDDELFVGASKALVEWLEEVKLPEWTGGEEFYLPFLMNDAAGDQNVTGLYRDYARFKALQSELDPDNFWSGRGGGFTY